MTADRKSLLPRILVTLLLVGLDFGLARPAPSSTDTDRAEQIEEFLSQGDRMEGTRLTVEVRDHIAILHGKVATIDQAEWAAAVCFHTDEVYGAVQMFVIDRTLYDADSAEDSLQHMFDHSPGLRGTRLVADAMSEPTIVISGQAGDPDEIELARELASRIDGVRGVQITATLNPLRPRPAAAIEAHLAFKTLDDPLLADLPVRFSVRKGKLTVAGEVGCNEVRRYLVSRSMIGGIREVDDAGLDINPALATAGMSDKHYHPKDSLKVLDLVFSMDPRLEGLDYQLSLDAGRIIVAAPSVTKDQTNAMIDNSRGLPGVEQVVFPLPTDSSRALSQR